ncbi:MAG: hypothetical protein JRE64_28420 [Deltaproteobacteria bacterium]|nr:hypothetical protein [Deltaproteobacteria bacterium]
MKKEIEKKRLKKELKSLFRSMDYISDNYLLIFISSSEWPGNFLDYNLSVKGIGKAKMLQILAAMEISRRQTHRPLG